MDVNFLWSIHMKKITLFIGALIMFGFSSLSFAETKIGVVDIDRILANSLQVQNAQIDLQNKFAPRIQDIIDLQNVFLNDIEKYKQNDINTPIDILQRDKDKLIDENNKLQETQFNFQRDVFTTRDKSLRPILKQVERIVNKIAQEQKIDLVISRLSTVYNNSQDEITIQAIADMGKLTN